MNPIQTQSQQSQDLADTLRAQKRQKEEIQESHEREMENLKQSYAAEKAESVDRFESSSQNERLNHYENLRKLKSQINREERDLESRGREAISSKSLRLQKEEMIAEDEGRKRVDQTLKKYAALEEYQRQSTKQANDEAHELRTRSTRQIMENAENGVESLRQQKNQYLEERKVNHAEALGEIDQHYRDVREGFETRHRDEFSAIEEKGFRELNQKRLEGSRILALEDELKSDPFYQLHRFESAMTDEGASYRLNVKVPQHERKNLRIQANGQDVQLIGTRVADLEAFEQGRSISTRTHQTLSEKINLDAPIDARAITRTETETGVEFRIPKYGPSHRMDADARNTAEADRNNHKIAKQIRFAESLPAPTFVSPKNGKGTLG
jgi:hypothetical protein